MLQVSLKAHTVTISQYFPYDYVGPFLSRVIRATWSRDNAPGGFPLVFGSFASLSRGISHVIIIVVANTLTQIDLLRRLQAAYPSEFSAPGNSSTALSAFRSGQIISPLAIEGLHQIGNSLSTLRLYHSLGVRYATLTHNCHNIYADAAITESLSGELVPATPYWGGLSPAGREAIHEMARLGMIVDLSHVSHDTMRDVLGDSMGTRVPVIFSHSNAYAVCPHPRNVPDDVLHLVKKRHSLVMVTFPPPFVSCRSTSDESGDTKKLPEFYPENSTLAHVVRHIKYIGELIGYDHVGLGSDYDGMPDTPRGLENVSKFLDLVAEILRQGITDEDAAKVVGGNILRVWNDVDAVAEKLQANGEKPAEDNLPWLKRHYS